MRYFDAHCHVQFPKFDEDRAEVIERMREAEVGGLVVGVDYASSNAAITLVEQHDHLWASVGLHPNDTSTESFDEETFRNLVAHPKVIAIGECGLDNYRPEDPEQVRAVQRKAFEAHVRLAGETKKPLMIHARPAKGSMDAYLDAVEIITRAKHEYPDLTGDFHFFVGDVDTARKILDLDFTMSFTAVLTFTRDYDEVVRFLPETHIITETDAPYVAPASRRGQRNDPLAVQDVVAAIAAIRGVEEETMRAQLLANATRLFSLK